MEENSSSIFGIDSLLSKELSEDELKEKLSSSLQPILKKEFHDEPKKQKIRVNKHDLTFACPYCGDSATDTKKKRGHFLLDGKFAGNYKCFNCGKFISIQKFFKDFNEEIDLSTTESLVKQEQNFKEIRTSKINAVDLFDSSRIREYTVPIQKVKEILQLQEISSENKNAGYYYLVGRMQFNFDNFLYDPITKKIIILNRLDDENIIGMQVRDISGVNNSKRKYLTFTLERIHRNILRDNIEIPEDVNRYSTYYNLFRVNIRKPIVVTEGPLDSFLLNNAIATCGVNNRHINLPYKFLWLFDDDDAGRKAALEFINKDMHVFMWDKFKHDYELPNRKKWDVNDVVLYLNGKGIKNINWYNYFDNDSFNILDI